jgi:hypothetical protein
VESDPGDDGKVARRFRERHQTPVVVESDDEVLFDIRDGRIVRAE